MSIELSPSDYVKSVRLAKILDILNKSTPHGGITCREIAEKLMVSTRQIYRDLAVIEDEMHIALIKEGKPIRYRLDRPYLPPLSPEQAIIIFLSLLQQKGSALTGHINAIKDALIAHLFKYRYRPETLPIEKLQERIHIVEHQLADPIRVGELFSRLLEAITESCRLKMWYYVAYRGEWTERVVEPYGLICKDQNWYLVGYCRMSNALRTFRVDQIKDIFVLTSERFEQPSDFSIKEYMGEAWGVINDHQSCRAVLKFRRGVAHRVQNIIYHPSQKVVEQHPDGSVSLSFEVCGILEFISWIMQWGENVEVLEPTFLRDKVRASALAIAAIYKVLPAERGSHDECLQTVE